MPSYDANSPKSQQQKNQQIRMACYVQEVLASKAYELPVGVHHHEQL